MEIFLTIFYFIIFSFIIGKIKFFNETPIPKYWFIIIFGIKLIFGIILTSIYTNYYTDRSTADIYKYFDDSQHIFDALKTNPIDYFQMLLGLDFNENYFIDNYYQHMSHWFRPYNNDLVNDSHIIIRFNAFVRLFSFGYFQVHNVFINFISLIGLTYLFKAFKGFAIKNEKLLFYVIFLMPSILFWGSGVLKESIIFFGFGLLIYHLVKIKRSLNPYSIILILTSLILLTFTKFYLVASLTIPVTGYFITNFFKLKRIGFGYLISFTLFIAAIITVPLISKQLDFISKVASKQQTFSRFVNSVDTKSGFKIPELSDATSLIINTPNALNNTIIRPYFWECNSLFVWFSALENHLVLLLLIFTFFFKKKIVPASKKILYFNLTFILFLFILIGLTTPVFGAIMRYKLPGLLLLLISLIIIIDTQKVKKSFPFLKNII